jgi:riboflavin biosynthesis pyrimidine reductase
MARPQISTNLALSADGKISSSPPCPSGWTSRADHARLLELRGDADAILVGRGTLEADRMTLTVPGKTSQPLRCIVSRTGEMDPEHPIFKKPGGAIHLLITGEFKGGEISGVTIHRGTLGEFLETLATEYHVERLHCEGGGQLIRALAALDAIDEFHVTLAGHTIFGGLDASTATGVPGDFLPASVPFRISHCEPRLAEGECFLSYTRCR